MVLSCVVVVVILAVEQAAIVDCGDDSPQDWAGAAKEEGLEITKILQTHGHVDHVVGLKATKELLPDAPIYACPDDWMVRL